MTKEGNLPWKVCIKALGRSRFLHFLSLSQTSFLDFSLQKSTEPFSLFEKGFFDRLNKEVPDGASLFFSVCQ